MRQTIDTMVDKMLQDRLIQLESHINSDVLAYYGQIDDGVESIFRDVVEGLSCSPEKKDKIAIILTTTGGSLLSVERMVNIVRHNYKEVDFIIPDYAYSAGTIFCMSGDNIFMDYYSVLGPIDPQVKNKDGKWVPALGYLDKIKELLERAQKGKLSQAEFIILKDFDLAEIRTYEQAKDLTVDLLKKWLVTYKFKNWNTHKIGKGVTDDEKVRRAEEIARELGNNSRWLSHGRPISIDQLRQLKLKIEDYTEDAHLRDLIDGYYRLMCECIYKYNMRAFIHTRGMEAVL
ncbi:hypothetical protein R80B4_01633 [Fibrobacteres bacterium R8-0-B4]